MRRVLFGDELQVLETLRQMEKRLARMESRLGKSGIEYSVQQIEQDVQAILRRLHLDPTKLPYPYRLTAHRFRLASQNEEDGVTLALFQLAGAPHCRFAEIGCGVNGGNSGFFAQELGWQGLMVDGDPDHVAVVRRRFGRNVRAVNAWVTRDGINELLATNGAEGEIDLLSIDIDGNDYWVWEAVEVCSPRLVIVEYNSLFGPDEAVVVPYDAQFDRHAVNSYYYGASLQALAYLGMRKGYRLVATEPRGVNAYFLRNDVAPDVPACSSADAFRMLDRYERAISEKGVDLFQIVREQNLPLVQIAPPVEAAGRR